MWTKFKNKIKQTRAWWHTLHYKTKWDLMVGLLGWIAIVVFWYYVLYVLNP